jgi:hypothetical protein
LSVKSALAASHAAVVNFVVVAGEMKQTVKNEHLELCTKRMAVLDGLAQGRGNTDCKIACDFVFVLDEVRGGKRQDVRRLVFAAILAVEAADFAVGCEQYADFATQAHNSLSLDQKPSQGAGGGNSSVGSGVKIQVWVEEDHRAQGRRLAGALSLS